MEPKYEDKYLLKYGALEQDFEQLQEVNQSKKKEKKPARFLSLSII